MPQIYNQVVLLNYAAGTTPQQLEQRINVPFKVGRIVFHPPFANILAADTQVESYFLQCSLNRDGVGIVGSFSGATALFSSNSKAVEVSFALPTSIDGRHLFTLRAFVEAAGGAAVPITARVYQHIEFHEFVSDS